MNTSLWNPLDTKNISDPYPMYARLRKEQPVYKAQTGEWIITKYEDVKSLLKNKDFISGNKMDWVKKGIEYFNNKDLDLSAIGEAINSFLLFLNGDQHLQARRLITRAWDDREVDDIIDSNISHLLHCVKGNKEFDLIEKFAQPLPAMTISKIMGLPMEDYEMLRAQGNHLLKVLDLYLTLKDMVEIERSAHFLVDYFGQHITRKRQHPENDLTSKIIKLNEEGPQVVSDRALTSLCLFLFLAGEETTVSLIGNGMLNLFRHQDQLQLLTNDQNLMAGAIEELLRYDSPVHVVGRIASKNTLFKGYEIKKGEICTLCLASANRDEDTYDQAAQFNIQRDPNRHLAFGNGIHFCLGDWLAKRQGALAFSSLIKLNLGLTDSTVNSIEWNKNLSIRSLKRLNVKMN
ncbi:cytochrome P450 [Fulvivirga sp. M361]|uniref:cytochrome P450 n=1 Tax=Fulvivirga sp. M361 TaxID=2594266 RepID=UPI001179B952|nr:cytochrome P450 [Fulvivirga sp. M361]TRX60824.1 cytochrome P450 [Fulvivirga sp. M361]